MLITGEPFRSGLGHDADVPCNVTSLRPQGEASRSIVHSILDPLAEMGAGVRVIATYPRSCVLAAHLSKWYSSYPLKMDPIASADMCDGWRHAYAAIEPEVATCDYIMQLRHDIVMDYPISRWNFNASRIQFERECTECAVMIDGQLGGSCMCGSTPAAVRRHHRRCDGSCVADHMLWSPGTQWHVLDDVVRRQRVCGHALAEQLRTSFPSVEYGYLFPQTCTEESQSRMPTLLCNEKAAYRPRRTRRMASGKVEFF